jgi:hypothetical protein
MQPLPTAALWGMKVCCWDFWGWGDFNKKGSSASTCRENENLSYMFHVGDNPDLYDVS